MIERPSKARERTAMSTVHGVIPDAWLAAALIAVGQLCRCIAVYFAASASAFGDSTSFEFSVAAGRYERKHVPVRVQMPRGQIRRIASVTLAGTDGKPI